MKTIKVKPILIESKENIKKEDIFIDSLGILRICTNLDYLAYNHNKENFKITLWKTKELILISLEDEILAVGDLAYNSFHTNEGVVLVDNAEYYTKRKQYVKVIARQSQIPSEYISKFIKQYNNKCIEDLEIEMEEIKAIGGEFGYKAKDLIFPKLTNGFITIVEKQEPIIYTEEQVLKLIQNWSNYLYNCKCYDITPMKYYEWFNENK